MPAPNVNLAEITGFENNISPSDNYLNALEAGLSTMGVPPNEVKSCVEGLCKSIAGALSIDIGAILLQSWHNTQSLKDAIEETSKDENAIARVQMAKHQVKTVHEPKVKVARSKGMPFEVGFEIECFFNISGLELEVSKGEISKIICGELDTESAVKAIGQTILKKRLLKMPLKDMNARAKAAK